MIRIDIPGRFPLNIRNLLLDINGTLTMDGKLIPGVKERIEELSGRLNIYLVTCDTLGNGERIAAELGVRCRRVGGDRGGESRRKAAFLNGTGAAETASIGNGNSDAAMIKGSALGIAVLGKEGLTVKALKAAHIVAPDINSALDLLIRPARLTAGLRG